MSTLQDRSTAAPRWQAPAFAVTAAELKAIFREWRRRARSRAELARLGAHELCDIGLTPAERARECAKPFWR
ncbi:MAG TPA: DUF1127 domain-containing protein [Stellaceae bacterium]|jgi:uncharacterized protein YjiS (DUF1127 family)|nr:DUF1127 domain-containing protein [Stellaceae bacterium]